MFGRKDEEDRSIWGSSEKEKKEEEKAAPRGMFDEAPKEEKKHYRGMFEEDRSSHRMTKKKERTIAIVVVIVALVLAVTALCLRVKWQRERLRRLMGTASSGRPGYSLLVERAPSQAPGLL